VSYVNKEKIEELIAVAKGCNLKIDEEELRNLIDYDGDLQEADDQIGLSLADNNESAHYHYSVANMGEYERTFLDLFESALKMLGIKEYKHKYEYIESSKSDDFEICVDEKMYNYNFRYGYTSDLELLNEFSIIASNHSETKIVEVHGMDESYILFLPPDLANYLDENFTFMQKI
jgi:hypothetical protein